MSGDGGLPVAGAYVHVVGLARAATADSLGRFLIVDVPAGMQTVRARLPGFLPLSLRTTVIAGQTVTLNFTLGASAVQLEGMTVVAYGEQERRDIVGSVASVPMERIADVPTVNVAQTLQSKVAGVDIVGSNYRPGASMNIRIRGVRSMVASNDPLFVVDGIPIAGGIEDFDPANIESIEVLKDASATAVYGSRGANGVVLVTTRRGGGAGGGRGTQITYDVQYGFQNPLHLVDMMDFKQYTANKIAAFQAAGLDTSALNLYPDPNEFAAYTAARASNWSSYPSTDWQQVILRTGRQARHQLGLNAIAGNTRLSLSGSYFDQAGITIGQGYQMYSGTASLDHTTGPLHVGLTITGTKAHTDVGMGDGLWGQALSMQPGGMPYDTLTGLIKWKPTNDPLLVNPLSELEFIRQLDRNRLFGSIFAELQLNRDLSWRMNFGPDISNNTDGRFRGTHTIDRNGAMPDAYFERQQNFGYTLDNLLRYNHEFAGQHRVEVTGLYSIQRNKYTMNHAEAANLPYDTQLWYNLGTGGVVGPVSSNLAEWALAGWMGRLNYVYHDRYALTVTGRYDGSSRLAEQHRWAFFPSVGLGWQLGDEPFFRRLPVVSRYVNSLKLRGSWGVSGNTAINPYQTQGGLSRTLYNFGNTFAGGYAPGSIPNPDLEWERTASTNVGVDFGLFTNRITGSLEFYAERTSKLLMNRQLPATSGFTSTLQNIGKVGNDGWEFNVSTVNLPGRRGPRWTTDLSLTHNRNYIISLYGKTLDDLGNRWFIGQPITVGGGSSTWDGQPTNSDLLRSTFYDYEMQGIWQLADSALAAVYGQKPGQIRVRDINGDGKINAADRVIRGNTYPNLLGSIYNRVTWGHFDVSMLFTFRLGYTLYDYFGVSNSSGQGRYNNIVVNYWTPERCPLNSPQSLTAACNTEPRPNAAAQYPTYQSARGYKPGGHSRIRNITVGYTVPTGVAHYFRMQSLRVYMQAQDPFLFSNYQGYDPEAGTTGSPPSYRTIVFGTTVGF